MTTDKTNKSQLTGKTTDELLDKLSLEEQISILAGDDLWSVNPIDRLGIGALRVTDGPSGARGSGGLVVALQPRPFRSALPSAPPGTRNWRRRSGLQSRRK